MSTEEWRRVMSINLDVDQTTLALNSLMQVFAPVIGSGLLGVVSHLPREFRSVETHQEVS